MPCITNGYEKGAKICLPLICADER